MDSTSLSPQEPLPEGWEVRTSNRTGITYYVNKSKRKAQWHKPEPEEPSPTAVLTVAVPPKVAKGPIRCSHILVKHNESRRPESWRTDNINRSRADAYKIIENFRKQIMSKEAKFEDIARIYSDCSSARHQGDLGSFKRGQMQSPFESSVFKLKVGQLSNPFETSSGIHIVLRTE